MVVCHDAVAAQFAAHMHAQYNYKKTYNKGYRPEPSTSRRPHPTFSRGTPRIMSEPHRSFLSTFSAYGFAAGECTTSLTRPNVPAACEL